MSENFADHPISIAELRSDKAENAALWGPRDALLSLLREFDQGKHDACDALVIVFRHKTPSGGVVTRFRVSGPDIHVTLGMMAHAGREMGAPE